MRTLCDACESAAALVFCAADEAALCRACDEKVHMCNKLASRHVRVGLAKPNNAPRCDICEDASAFFYCETDGSSLCLECDVIVHVGAKRKHIRYLLLRQRIEFPGDKPVQAEQQGQAAGETCRNGQNKQNHDQAISPDRKLESNSNGQIKMDSEMIDLNLQPHRNDE